MSVHTFEAAAAARRSILHCTAVAAVLLLTACAPSTDPVEPPASPPDRAAGTTQSAPPVARPSATLPDGSGITLELAITPDELAQGLMFRPSLAPDRGMLLIFAEERLPNIWMMNMLIALDLVYLDRSGTVVDVITGAQPCPGEPCPRFTPKQPAQAVLEVPAGVAAAHGIVEGSKLVFSNVPGFPIAD